MRTEEAAAGDRAANVAARRRLARGDIAPPIIGRNILGIEVTVPAPDGLLTHVQFLRFANCPICNLHLQAYIKRIGEIRAAGVREMVLFHSDVKHLADYQSAFPFDVIADPTRKFFNRYRIEKSAFAVIGPRAWPSLIAGYRMRPSFNPDSSTFGLPADFLIGTDGRIMDCHYGTHAADQWTLDTMLRLAAARP
jgi:peroxiredoxin